MLWIVHRWIFGFDFVDKEVWPEKCGPEAHWAKDNENTLYKFMYPTSGYRNIAWCGLCQPLHSQFLVSEIHSRHAVASFLGEVRTAAPFDSLQPSLHCRGSLQQCFDATEEPTPHNRCSFHRWRSSSPT